MSTEVGSEYLQVAKHAAIIAGHLIFGLAQGNRDYLQKTSHTDIVTQADQLADINIRKSLELNCPNHSILSEEGGRTEKDPRFWWIVDSLDSTISFISGLPFYSVSIGLNIDGQPVLGVINRVATGELYAGEIGYGASCNGRKISVSKKTDLKQCVIGLDVGYQNRAADLEQYYKPLVDRVRYAYTLGGTAVGLALVANGSLDAYIHKALVWDFAGGVPIVLAAGGMATSKDGGLIDWSQEKMTVVSSNGRVHNQIIEILNG